MDQKETSVVFHHARNKRINGKNVQIDYEEVLQPDGRSLVRYKTYVENIPLALEFAISKEVLQMLHKNHNQSIYSDIPDSILEWCHGLSTKSLDMFLMQNGKPVSSCRPLECV